MQALQQALRSTLGLLRYVLYAERELADMLIQSLPRRRRGAEWAVVMVFIVVAVASIVKVLALLYFGAGLVDKIGWPCSLCPSRSVDPFFDDGEEMLLPPLPPSSPVAAFPPLVPPSRLVSPSSPTATAPLSPPLPGAVPAIRPQSRCVIRTLGVLWPASLQEEEKLADADGDGHYSSSEKRALWRTLAPGVSEEVVAGVASQCE